MKHFLENGELIGYVKDIIEGKPTNITPDDLVGEVKKSNDIWDEYDASEDPEAQRLTESSSASTLEEDRVSFFLDSSDDISYQAFLANAASTGINITEGKYNSIVDKIRKMNNLEDNKKEDSFTDLAYGKPKASLDGKVRQDFDDLSSISSDILNSGSNDVDAMFADIVETVESIASGTAQTRHAMIYGDPGVGKTYTIKKAVTEVLKSKGRENRLVYEAGDIGKSMTSLAGFFHTYKDDYIILLDDNDSMLATPAQNIANFLKGILDPSALTKPVSVPASILKRAEIEAQSFKENDSGEKRGDYLNKYILGNTIRLREDNKTEEYEDTFADIDFDEIDSWEKETENLLDDPGEVQRQFTFNSSVIFISNLSLQQINSAVSDRVTMKGLSLTLDQFMERLKSIFDGLCKAAEYNSTPQDILDWAKKCMLTGFEAFIEHWDNRKPLGPHKIIINRKFTFRAFEQFVDSFIRRARMRAKANNGNLNDPVYRDSISRYTMVEVMVKDMIPWAKEITKGTKK